MAVIITNETKRRLQRESRARVYQEKTEKNMHNSMNTYISHTEETICNAVNFYGDRCAYPKHRGPHSWESGVVTGYCVRERKKVPIRNPRQITMRSGRPAIKGACPDCGTPIFKLSKL